MKLSILIALLAACVANALVVSFNALPVAVHSVSSNNIAALSMAYVPDGLSAAEWKKIQAKEKEAQKNLGKMGVTRFKSRSFAAWQEAGSPHLFPVDPAKVKSGEIPMKDVPYMQRGGAWDNSDLKGKAKRGADKMSWNQRDKDYANGGEKAQQSSSIFGYGSGMPWNKGFQQMDSLSSDPLKVQSKVKRATASKAMSKKVQRQIAEEEREMAKKKKQLEKQLASEGKKGFMGLW
ncbi:unnamed protein product [Chrysoparadoxa australica]